VIENNQPPCKDCITLGVCRARLSESTNYSYKLFILSTFLIYKCSLLFTYIYDKNRSLVVENYHHVQQFLFNESVIDE
jgi:hypothetical protein